MRRYLLVDDNEAFSENLAEILRDDGAEVMTANGGPQAIERVRAERYDALLTDMRMPVMSGAGVVHAIRRIDPGLPALVVTAYTGDDDLAAARQEGLLAVLPKPTPIALLISLLKSAKRSGLVVIVEDDERLADNLCELLRERGYSAIKAASVMETERLGPVAPFLALVDMRVPGGPGGEALRRLEVSFPKLPRLIITGYPEEIRPENTSRVFTKPFDSGELMRAVDGAYAQRGGA